MNMERMRILRQMLVEMKSDPLLDDRGNEIRFDMSDFIARVYPAVSADDAPPCGTACCMAGAMMFYPAFQQMGITLDSGDHPEQLIIRRNGHVDTAFYVAKALLGLDHWQANCLFTSGHFINGVRDERAGNYIFLSDMTLDHAITRVDRAIARPHDFVP